MLSATAPDFPESKVNRLVENVAAIWKRTAATRGTQMIFCRHGRQSDRSGAIRPTTRSSRNWSPTAFRREQIAAIGDAESDAKKQALFEKVRQGSVRVLIGSTQKMGTGTNVQKRLVALHHLDAPWKPAEVEQRDGRILRQGNENEEVAIYRYVTEGSFDAYMWQALETKARFIGQVITGDNAARRAEDIGGQELSYAEVKAIASGNPAVLTLAEADAELQRLTLLKKNHLDEQYVARRSVRDLPATIASLSERLSKLTADEATANAHADDPITIGGRTCSREDVPDILGGKLDALPTQRPRDDPRAARHLSRPALRHRASSAIPARGVSRRRDHPPVHAVAGAPGAACRPERPGTPGRRLRLRMRPRPARPRHRRVPASRLPGPPRQALPARRLPVRTDQLARPAQGRPFRRRPRSQATRTGRAFPNWPSRSRRSRPPTASRPRRSASGRSIPPPRNPSPPASAAGRRRFPPPIQRFSHDAASPAGTAAAAGIGQDSSIKPPMTFQERIAMERQRKDQEPSLS